jgi:hypothetical protein
MIPNAVREMQDLGGRGKQYRAARGALSNRSPTLLHDREGQSQRRRHISLHAMFYTVGSAHDRQRVQPFCVASALMPASKRANGV